MTEAPTTDTTDTTEWIYVKEAAARLGVHQRVARALISEAGIPVWTLKRRERVRAEDLQDVAALFQEHLRPIPRSEYPTIAQAAGRLGMTPADFFAFLSSASVQATVRWSEVEAASRRRGGSHG